MLYVTDYSADGRSVTDDGIQSAMDHAPLNGCRIAFPPGKWPLTRTINITTPQISFIGECDATPRANKAATELTFPPDTPGVLIQGPPTDHAELCSIKGIQFTSLPGSTQGHGIEIRSTRSNMENCGIHGFGEDGIRIIGGVNFNGWNSNLAVLNKINSSRNGSHGIHIIGSDANNGDIQHAELSGNGGWGIMEEGNPKGTLGTGYRRCTASANKLGAYGIFGPSSESILDGCYSENNQPPSWIAQKAMAIGGDHGAGIDLTIRNGMFPGVWVHCDAFGLKISLMESLSLRGFPRPPATGSIGSFTPVGSWGFHTIGWRCVGTNRFVQEVV